MGEILGSKVTNDGKVVFSISLNHEEALQLRGYIDDIHIFSEKVADIKTNLCARGKNEATKYFLIPRELRRDLKFGNNISCQRLETKSRIIFIYLIDKYKL